MRLRVATCLELPEPDPDEAPLAAALLAAGIEATWCGWDDPDVRWDEPVPCLLHSTWNYTLAVESFLSWCERVAARAPLFNSFAVVRANWHKRYLLELAGRGVAVVPTLLHEPGSSAAAVSRCIEERGWSRVVVKPAVGAASLGVSTFGGDEQPALEQHLGRWSSRGAVLIQPYLPSIEDYGERSVVIIDGAISHAIRKSPRFAGEAESISGPVPITKEEAELALRATAPWSAELLYARVDMARGADGKPLIMELEMIEPSLYLAYAPGAAERLVSGLLRRLASSRPTD